MIFKNFRRDAAAQALGRKREELTDDEVYRFEREQALKRIDKWEAAPVVKEYLTTGNESLREAAYKAAADAVWRYNRLWLIDLHHKLYYETGEDQDKERNALIWEIWDAQSAELAAKAAAQSARLLP